MSSSNERGSEINVRVVESHDDTETDVESQQQYDKAKSLKVDDSKQTYELKRILRKRNDGDQNNPSAAAAIQESKQVTFDHVVLVTPYRDTTTSMDPAIMRFSSSDGAAATRHHHHHHNEDEDDEDGKVVTKRRRYACFVRVHLTCELLIVLLISSSGFVLGSTIETCLTFNLPCDHLSGLALACGATSFIVNSVCLLWMLLKGKMDSQVFSMVYTLMSCFWFISCLALSIPSNGPFFFMTTGFFASWACFILSLCLASFVDTREVNFVLYKLDILTDSTRSRQLFLTAICCLLTFSSSIGVCASSSTTSTTTTNSCDATTIFAIVWSICSFILSGFLVHYWKELDGKYYTYASLALAVVLSIGTLVTTVIGPFVRGVAATGFIFAVLGSFLSWCSFFSRDPRAF